MDKFNNLFNYVLMFFKKNKFILFFSERSLNNIIKLLFGISLFFVPIIFVFNSFTPFVVSKTSFFICCTEIITFLFLCLVVLYPEYRPKKNYILYGFLVFISIAIISGIFGVSPIISFWSSSIRADGTLLLAHIFLFFLVIASVVKSKKDVNFLIFCSIFSSVVVTISVYFSVIPISIAGRYFPFGGLLANDSYAGSYLLFNLFFIVYIFFEYEHKKIRLLLSVFFVFLLFSPIFFNFDIFLGKVSFSALIQSPMLLIGSARGATISLFLGLVCFVILLFLNSKKKIFYASSRIIAGAYFFSIFLVVALLFVPNSNFNKWFMEETGGYRAIYWHQAIEGFKEKPILGWGPGNFRIVNVKYFDPNVYSNAFHSGEIFSDKAHNIIFDTLVSSGILGLLAYFFVFFISLFLMWRSKRITIVAKSVFAGLFLAYFLQNLIFFDSLVSWLMFSFSLAIIVVLDNISPGNENEKIQFERNKTSKFIYLALFLLGAGTLFLVRYFAILPLKQNSEDYQFYNLPPDVRSSLYSNKNEISPFGRCSDYLINTAVVYEQNLNLLQQDNLEKNISLTRKEFVDKQVSDIDGQILEIKKSCQHERESYFEVHAILELYSLRQKIMGDLDYTVKEMERYGKEETLLSPRNPNTYAEYSNTLVLEGKYFEALIELEKAFNITPSNYSLNVKIIDVARKIGDPKSIDEKIRRAKAIFPKMNF